MQDDPTAIFSRFTPLTWASIAPPLEFGGYSGDSADGDGEQFGTNEIDSDLPDALSPTE